MTACPFPDAMAEDIAHLMAGSLPHVPDTLDGEAVFRVPLNNRTGTFATLCRHGYDLLVARGADFLIGNEMGSRHTYVLAQRPGHLHRWDLAGRLIVGASEGQLVRYANGDRTDLRLSNLRLQQTKAKAA